MRFLPIFLLLCAPAMGSESPYHAIVYHDIRDDVAGDFDPDQYAVSTRNLIAHFSWLRDNDFQPISMDQIIAAQEGRQNLPDKAVLLTFDDGLLSVYTKVFPLLKLFNYPAVVSVVTNWVGTENTVVYADREVGHQGFLTWDQIRELKASGLVEIASHTDNLHQGITGNPQGNLQPAAVTRLYSAAGYETEHAYLARIDADLARSVAAIKTQTGQAPRVITWPYGAYTYGATTVAAKHGMNISLNLSDQVAIREETLHVGRDLAVANPTLQDFSSTLLLGPVAPIVRVAQIDLDYVFDTDPVQQSANLGVLLDRIKSLEISHVFLQAFADPDGDGAADAVYFPNRHLPVRADLFNRVAWQLKTRADVSVFAWLPLLSFTGGSFDSQWRVLERRGDVIAADPDAEPRLSPFNEDARARIGELYEDLATHANFSGLLFHDDGRLNEFEDFSPDALAHYQAALGQAISPEILASNPALTQQWTELKARTLVDFSGELAARVRQFRPQIKTVRNIFASALLDEDGIRYLAQDYDSYLRAYDYVALMAMPALEGHQDHRAFFEDLITEVRQRELGVQRTIFELQTTDWAKSQPVSSANLRQTMRWLQSQGIRHLGYYPDDFVSGHPDFDELRSGISLAEFHGGTKR